MAAITTQALYGINFPAEPAEDDQDFWLFLDESALMLEADAWAKCHDLDIFDLDEFVTVSLNEATDGLRHCGYDLALSSDGRFLLATDNLGFTRWLAITDGRVDAYDLETVYLGS